MNSNASFQVIELSDISLVFRTFNIIWSHTFKTLTKFTKLTPELWIKPQKAGVLQQNHYHRTIQACMFKQPKFNAIDIYLPPVLTCWWDFTM